jgi:uncharacterized BrkB/YihY/UPF0761 family membrane protein
VLTWVYYTSQIILMGAEVTYSYARHNGSLRRQVGRGGSAMNEAAYDRYQAAVDAFLLTPLRNATC